MWFQCFEKLKGKIAEDLIDLKDGHGESAWEYVHEKSLGYFSRNCLDKPWTNHVALLMLTKALSQYDAVSVLKSIQEITPRLNDFFSMFELKSVEEFKADDHIYKYLTLQLFKEHFKAKRAKFASSYNSSNRVAHEWIRNKCDNLTAQKLKPYLLPIFSYHAREIHAWKQAHDQAAEIRKTETDAIAPLYPNLRAEAHLRWNQLKRLRKKYIQAINEVEKKQLELPLQAIV
jgi:hypothetical protein